MHDELDGPLAVISPHLDDAVVSAWSVLRTEPDVAVVVVFAGVPPEGTTGAFDPIFGTSDSAALVRVRRDEDRAALRRAGRTPTHLDLLDGQYRSEPLEVAAVIDAIDATVPPGSTLVAPAGIGRHLDHLLARDAAVAVARDRGERLYLFADQPYATNMGWPSWVTGEPADPRLVPDAAWRSTLAEVADPATSVPIVRSLDPAEQAEKVAALRCYDSQFPALEGGPHRRLSNPAIAAFELLWLIEPSHLR